MFKKTQYELSETEVCNAIKLYLRENHNIESKLIAGFDFQINTAKKLNVEVTMTWEEPT